MSGALVWREKLQRWKVISKKNHTNLTIQYYSVYICICIYIYICIYMHAHISYVIYQIDMYMATCSRRLDS